MVTKEEVKNWQRRLKELGLDPGPIDGVFGPQTKKAVREFQRMHKLKDDGIVGPLTHAEMFPQHIPERDSESNVVVAPSLPGVTNLWPAEAGVEKFYGKVNDIPKYMEEFEPPYPLWYAGNLNYRIKKIALHEKVIRSAERVLIRVKDAYGDEVKELNLDVYGGGYNKRLKRGGTTWSMHAYAIAMDWNPAENKLRWNHMLAELAKPAYSSWWKLWREEGWVGLGPTRDYDWMHVQAARV
jgi:hypothetical protein